MEHLVSLRSVLARLGLVRLVTMGGVVIAVLSLLAWVASGPTESKGLLYSGLDPADAGHIAGRLDELHIPYEARGDGTTLFVPVSQVARVRMELAAAGLPHQAGAGYELLDNQSPMNMTSFMQHVQRLRALEGELARTILTMSGVKSARVHIVLPERESFARDAPPPTASVAVTMSGPLSLSAGQAAAIRLLIAGAVPRMRQEDVSVLDPSGIVLAADGANAVASGRLAEMKIAQEHALQRSVLDMLEPIVGRGRARAVVSLDLENARETSREERFDPLTQVERSKQTQQDQENSDETRPRDPVSVGQNLPNQPQGVSGKTTTATTRNGQTINYEISSTLNERIREPGSIRRLSISVVLDGDPARPKAELDRLAGLVRGAVGFDEKRGDSVTVESMRFMSLDASGTGADEPAAAGVATLIPGGVPALVAVLILVLLVGGGGGTIMMRRRRQLALARAAAEQMALAPPPAENEDMVRLAGVDQQIRASFLAALHDMVDTRPEEVLAVIRAWINESSMP